MSNHYKTGFTLVEICVVVAILALLAAAAALTVRLPLSHAQHREMISRVKTLDALARDRARGSTAPVQLIVSKSEGVIELLDTHGGAIANAIAIPKRTTLESVLGVTGSSESDCSIGFDRFGTSQSYALQFVSESGKRSWLVVLGMTGQTYLFEDEKLVHSLFVRSPLKTGGRIE